MKLGIRPCIVIGAGCTDAKKYLPKLMDCGIPVLTSWQAMDLVDNYHPSYYGRPGIYGQRLANKVMYNSDHIISIGCRLSVWMVGYDKFQREGRLTVVDIDEKELARFPSAECIRADAKEWVRWFSNLSHDVRPIQPWVDQCRKWAAQYPWLEPHHKHGTYINPHRFIYDLGKQLKTDAVIVTDCATGNLCAHQILRLSPRQRIITSGGLGEMGCGLPAAIGASFARNKGEVICLMTDGAMMMNLQELQTIATHNLPIKIIVFSNDGYGMIRGAQKNMGWEHVGVNGETGVECPKFSWIAESFNINNSHVSNPLHVSINLDELFVLTEPSVLDVNIDPAYQFSPKLQPIRLPDGTIKNATFEEMT